MISHYLQSVPGMQLLGIVSLLVCVVLFVFIVVRALRADKTYLRTMAGLPLDNEPPHAVSSEKVHQ